MAMLVRTVCRDCGQPVQPRGTGARRVYRHAVDAHRPGPRVDATYREATASLSGCDAAPVLIRMETITERY